MSHKSAWRRCCLVIAVAATTSVGVHTEAAPLAAQTHDAPFMARISSAQVLRPASRIRGAITAPNAPPPSTSIALENTVSFNSCTANIVRDDHGAVLGIVGAAHCIGSSFNVMRDGHTFGTGNRLVLDRSQITRDTSTDMFYVGLNGRSAADVRAQLVSNYRRVDMASQTADSVAVMTGYPTFSNPSGEPVTLSLKVAGIVHWPRDPNDTIAAFGNWNSRNQSCSPGASGSGLYHWLDGQGYVIVGVLSSRAEFDRVQTMPYPPAYGLELRQYFESQLDRKIDAEFMCGFAPPTV